MQRSRLHVKLVQMAPCVTWNTNGAHSTLRILYYSCCLMACCHRTEDGEAQARFDFFFLSCACVSFPFFRAFYRSLGRPFALCLFPSTDHLFYLCPRKNKPEQCIVISIIYNKKIVVHISRWATEYFGGCRNIFSLSHQFSCRACVYHSFALFILCSAFGSDLISLFSMARRRNEQKRWKQEKKKKHELYWKLHTCGSIRLSILEHQQHQHTCVRIRTALMYAAHTPLALSLSGCAPALDGKHMKKIKPKHNHHYSVVHCLRRNVLISCSHPLHLVRCLHFPRARSLSLSPCCLHSSNRVSGLNWTDCAPRQKVSLYFNFGFVVGPKQITLRLIFIAGSIIHLCLVKGIGRPREEFEDYPLIGININNREKNSNYWQLNAGDTSPSYQLRIGFELFFRLLQSPAHGWRAERVTPHDWTFKFFGWHLRCLFNTQRNETSLLMATWSLDLIVLADEGNSFQQLMC